jgi:hypothetical protein
MGRTQVNNTNVYLSRLRSAGGKRYNNKSKNHSRSSSKNRIMSSKNIKKKGITLNATSRNQLPMSEMDHFSSDNEMGNGIAEKSFQIKSRVKSAHKQGMMHQTISRK